MVLFYHGVKIMKKMHIYLRVHEQIILKPLQKK